MTNIGIIYNQKLRYPEFPYNPDKLYPEIKYEYNPQSDNLIYNEMRNLFLKLGYDKENFNTKDWNPLGFLINKGDKVLIKPNFVIDNDKYPFSVITHPSIIRFLIDYAYIATGNSGEIIVGDAPQMNANLKKILDFTKFDKLLKLLQEKNIPVEFLDFRPEFVENGWKKRTKLKGDPLGYKIVDLKEKSLLFELEKDKEANFYGADYNRKIVNNNHNIYRNTYCISQTLLDSDVVISVPKLKTHKKAGVTLNLKNFIGINVHKNYLPHYRIGCPKQGGDSFPNMNSFLNWSRFLLYLFRDCFLSNYNSKIGRVMYRLLSLRAYIESIIVKILFPHLHFSYFHMIDGDWIGNDTIWRTILDLNLILRYSDKKGNLKPTYQRKLYSVIDGIIAGDKNGPLKPGKIKAGTIIMGEDHVLTDLVAVKIMGFNFKNIRLLKNVLLKGKNFIGTDIDLNNIKIISNNNDLDNLSYNELNLNLNFAPPKGWEEIKENN